MGRWVIESRAAASRSADWNGHARVGPVAGRGSGGGIGAASASTVEFAGVTTTPGVAYLAKNGPFAAGVMISASHNPYQDNGIKLIGHAGYKLPDEQEELLEKEIFSLLDQGAYSPPAPLAVNTRAGSRLHRSSGCNAAGRFERVKDRRRLRERIGFHPCARTFRAPGRARASHPLLARRPQHQSQLRLVASGSFAGGRCWSKRPMSVWPSMAMPIALCSSRGPERSSMATRCCSSPGRYLKEHGQLTVDGHPPLMVATVMSNLGLERALCAHGIDMIRTPVGDKYVLEEMLTPRRGARRRTVRPRHLSSLRYHRRWHADGAARVRGDA